MSNAAPVHVLLVDDDEDEFVLVRDSLLEFGSHYTLDWEPHYEAALQKAISNQFDVYLLDFRLGAKSGLDFLKEARAMGCDGNIILVTGYRNDKIDIDAVSLGADDLLIKGEFGSASLDRSIRYSIDRKRTQVLIANQYKELASALKMASLGEIAGGIAHEIMNPVTIILGRTGQCKEALDADPLDRKLLNEHIASIETVTLRVLKIIKSLRSFINAGSTAKGKISIHPVINDIESLCATNCKMAGISLELPKFSEPIFAISSYSELVQVLFILISNAFDEISKNKENLWIKVEIQENKQDGFLEISVTDSGKGIPKDVQEKIFSPFFSTKGTKGSGLGLSVARRLVESHQGKLYLDSSSPNTRFVIRLHSADAYAASSLPVLVIDDESAVIEVITKAFSNRLVPTLSANNGEQALDLIYRHSFRAIVTDLRMPGLDGIGLLERLKKFNFPLPPVFVISGFYSNKMPEVLKAIPIRQFYEKPVNLEKLITDVIEAS